MKTLLNTPEERHAFAIGLCEVLCPWPPRVRVPSPLMGEGQDEGDNLNRTIQAEHHYYLAGRALGVIAWLIIAKIIQEAFW